ncbi:MAG: CAP domain-containing protein [Pyrinomonadaceae bacterium]
MYARMLSRAAGLAVIIVGSCLAIGAQGTRGPGKVGPLGVSSTSAPGVPNPADILTEINLARANPAKYAAYLETMKKQFHGSTYQRPGRPGLTTNEGVAAVDEAIRFLKSAKPLPALKLSAGMSRGANDQATDMVRNQVTGHKGSDGSLPEDRCTRYGRLTGSQAVGENIAYEGLTAREVVEGYIVDDGTANRGHRRNVFSATYKFIGVGVGQSGNAEPIYVVMFAEGFTEKGPAPGKGRSAVGPKFRHGSAKSTGVVLRRLKSNSDGCCRFTALLCLASTCTNNRETSSASTALPLITAVSWPVFIA